MDVGTLESMARSLGARQVSSAGDRVRCECLLARWTHSSGHDSNPSMVLFPEGNKGDPIYSCQSCHEKGSVFSMLLFLWSRTGMDLFGWIEMAEGSSSDVPKANVKLRERVLNINVMEVLRKSKVISRFVEKDDEMPVLPWSAYDKYKGSVPRYALERGLTMETCKAWNLGHDRYRKRLMFPIANTKGQLVATSGRLYACPKCGHAETVKPVACDKCGRGGTPGPCACGGEIRRLRERCAKCGLKTPPKYMHSKGFKRNLIVFGEDRVQDAAPDGRVYVTEGHMDAVMLWQYGFRPAVALLGSSPGKGQIKRLKRSYKRLIVVGDGDKAGHEMADAIKRMAGSEMPVAKRCAPNGEDPGSMTFEALLELLGEPTFSG